MGWGQLGEHNLTQAGIGFQRSYFRIQSELRVGDIAEREIFVGNQMISYGFFVNTVAIFLWAHGFVCSHHGKILERRFGREGGCSGSVTVERWLQWKYRHRLQCHRHDNNKSSIIWTKKHFGKDKK
ncbi:hypothetical protein E2542_SST25560 [Spatholobus suberectus]|nr:hypothetical protein E2542_SST25560 [Spatholobus suberectus]